MTIVEHAFDGDVVDVGVLQAEHLRLLEGALRPCGDSMNTRTPFLPRMAYSATAGVASGAKMFSTHRRPSSYSNRLPSNCMTVIARRPGRAVGQGFAVPGPLPAASGGVISCKAITPAWCRS